jgi:transcriptional regulator with XRE-family HTH domain
MKRFAAALRDAMTDLGWTDSELARRTGKRQSSVADWLSDDRYRPTIPVLEAIMAALPEDYAVPILIAHLHDQLPDAARYLVNIVPTKTSGHHTVREGEDEPTMLAGLPRREQEIVRWTAQQLQNNSTLRDLLEINRKILGGEK